MREGSYSEIEPGMSAVGTGGDAEKARVEQVLYDEASDIFVGLVIDPGNVITRHRLMVRGEDLEAVRRGEVILNVPFSTLQPYVSPEEKFAHAQQQHAAPGPADGTTV
jgi:hypothetical protein